MPWASEATVHTGQTRAVDQVADGILVTGSDGIVQFVDSGFTVLTGYSAEDAVGKPMTEFVPAEWQPDPESAKDRFPEFSLEFAATGFALHKDAQSNRLSVVSSPIRDSAGNVTAIVFTFRDLPKCQVELEPCSQETPIGTSAGEEGRLAAATRALRTSEARYRTIFHTSLDSVTINRLSDGEFIDVNNAFLDLTGWQRKDVIGQSPSDTAIWADAGIQADLAKGLHQSSSLRDIKTQIRKKNGDLISVLMSASVIELEGVSCVVCVMKDISGARAAEDEIRKLAFYDPLTRLPNRRLLLDQLQYALEPSSRRNCCRALLLVDLDDFKLLNDTLSHQAGDLFLQEVALRLAGCLREAEMVSRFGGDEFAILLSELSDDPEDAAAQANGIAERILDVISQPYRIAEHEIRCNSSIGITVFKEHPHSTDEILKQVDIALYQAKAAGRNTMRLFAPSLQAAVNDRATLEADLRKSIKQGHFLLYYQPQVDSGRVIGAEALIRWNHPTRGILLPGEFIPFAEERGLILPLGNWVIETACKQIAAWANRGETSQITVAVNISARQFLQPDFVAQVLTALSCTGANPKRLRLELTESMLVHDFEEVTAKMRDLNSYGLKFSLDDFGTGYSSLSYLKRLPLDQLKIDRSFIRDIFADASGGAIAEAIISLGRAMGLTVIAEGVETEEQREFLASLGCHAIQGYLFSRPLPIEEFQQLLALFAKSAGTDSSRARLRGRSARGTSDDATVAPVSRIPA